MENQNERPRDLGAVVETPATRRNLIKAGVAAVGLGAVGIGGPRVLAQDATPDTVATPTECVLTPEMTEGPYYVDGQLIRGDITEGKPGVPLVLQIAVQDIGSCAPLANAAVELWHCDAQGYYSGIVGENPGGGGEPSRDENAATTFLRGIQLTDENGIAEFATIYPGWYTGRTVHIHMKVHVEGEAGDTSVDEAAMATPEGGETYQGGHTSHVGQLFFDDALSDEVFATEAYARDSEDGRLANEDDNILGEHDDEPGFLLAIEGSVDAGLIGTITVGVDPTATASEGGMDGGGGAPPDGGEGGPPPGSPPAGGPGGPPPGEGTPPAGA